MAGVHSDFTIQIWLQCFKITNDLRVHIVRRFSGILTLPQVYFMIAACMGVVYIPNSSLHLLYMYMQVIVAQCCFKFSILDTVLQSIL